MTPALAWGLFFALGLAAVGLAKRLDDRERRLPEPPLPEPARRDPRDATPGRGGSEAE
jgi:hypothetical protein